MPYIRCELVRDLYGLTGSSNQLGNAISETPSQGKRKMSKMGLQKLEMFHPSTYSYI